MWNRLQLSYRNSISKPLISKAPFCSLLQGTSLFKNAELISASVKFSHWHAWPHGRRPTYGSNESQKNPLLL